MLGTLLMLALIVVGFMHVTPYVLIPATIAAAFIGVHYPPGKALVLIQRNQYWGTLLYSIPLQLVLASFLYGIGYGLGYLFK
jgi:hypothetical protein